VIHFVRLAAALALAGAAISSPAYAAAVDTDTVRLVIRIADLNLANVEGRSRLAARIDAAATSLCGHADQRDIPMARQAQKCRVQTVADTQPQVALAVSRAMGRQQYAANDITITAHAF